MQQIIIQLFLDKMSSPSSSNYLSTLSTQNSNISSTFSMHTNLSRRVSSLEGGR